MSTSPSRRFQRMQDRTAKKLYNKIAKQTMEQIMKQPPKEREEMLALYKQMNGQKQVQETPEQFHAKEMDAYAKRISEETIDWFDNIDKINPLDDE